MRLTNESKVGIFFVLALLVLIVGFNYMQGTKFLSSSNSFYVVYDDVDGLRTSNPVLLNGFQVGKVNEIKMAQIGGETKIVARIGVSKEVSVNQQSIAKIINYDLLGAKAIELQISKETPEASHLDTLVGTREPGISESFNELLAPVKLRTENLIVSVDSVVNTLHRVLETAEIEHMFISVQNILGTLENTFGRIDTIVSEESTRLDRIFANVESITKNFRESNQEFTNVVTNLSKISDSVAAADIKRTIEQTHETLAELDMILKKINQGEGTAGLLINDDELYHRLNNVTESMDRLTNDVRRSPGRYVNFSLINLRRTSTKSEPEED